MPWIQRLAIGLVFAATLPALSAAVIEFDPDRLVTLELSNGNTVSGRIIEVQTDRLQLVRAGFNRMIAFEDLSPATRKTLGLPDALSTGKPAPVTPLPAADLSGINSTRDRLRESLARYDASRYQGWSSQLNWPVSYTTWPIYSYPFPIYPGHPGCFPPGHGGGWNIQIGF